MSFRKRGAARPCRQPIPRIESSSGEPPVGPVRCAGMNTILAVAIGGAAGSVARYLTQVWAGKLFGIDFPWGTLAVNVLGSLIMGVLVEFFALRWPVDPVMRAFLTIGILGGYTTFSSFSLDVMVLVQRGEVIVAGTYILASVIVSLAAIFGGLHLVRWILA
jgi:CrcB protein